MKTLIKHSINFIMIYLIYLIYTLIFLTTNVIKPKIPGVNFLAPLIISFIFYLSILGLMSFYHAIKNKRNITIFNTIIYIALIIVMLIQVLSYADNSEIPSIILAFSGVTIYFFLVPYLFHLLTKKPFSKIQLFFIGYLLAVVINAYISYELFNFSIIYIIILALTFPLVFFVFDKLNITKNMEYPNDFVNQVKKMIIDKRFIHCITNLILLVVFIYGLYILSHATETVHDWVFEQYSSISPDTLKNYIIEERIKGAVLTGFGGLGLLIKLIASSIHYYSTKNEQ